ncbi:MAG: hypothetical protein JW395_1608 [Nitrospira sp.]|nr:hypothetical protein [Nitrospira sp.]
MWTERFCLTEKAQTLTSLFDRIMDLRNSLRLRSLLPMLRRPDPQHAWTVRTRKGAESFKQHIHRCSISNRLFNRAV